jgi:hypothetical protein
MCDNLRWLEGKLHTHTHTHIHTYTHTNTHTHIHTYTNTHTHTNYASTTRNYSNSAILPSESDLLRCVWIRLKTSPRDCVPCCPAPAVMVIVMVKSHLIKSLLTQFELRFSTIKTPSKDLSDNSNTYPGVQRSSDKGAHCCIDIISLTVHITNNSL